MKRAVRGCLIGGWVLGLLAGCATASRPSEPWSPTPTRQEIQTAMESGLVRSQQFTQVRLPRLHRQFNDAIGRLDAPASSAAVRHQAQVDLREADFQANQITVDTGVQLNAVQAAAEPWLAQCSGPELKDASECRAFVDLYDRWDQARQAMWAELTGPVLRWRDAANAAIARHPNDPVVPVDYLRGAPRCMVHDLRQPSDHTAI